MNEWILTIIIGAPGLALLIITYAALLVSIRSGHYVSGAPLFGGLLIIAAFLLSPIKPLALLGLLDYGIWTFPYLLIRDKYREWKSKKTITAKDPAVKNNRNNT